MKMFCLAPLPLALMVLAAPVTAFEACRTQKTFDITMCKSYMCTKCTLAYCASKCQELQTKNAGCTCEDWPAGRTSYSEDFLGKGKCGDVGDYSRGPGSPSPSP